MKKIGIYINSANRADNVLTIRQFPIAWKKFTHIVVPKDQASSYEHYGWPVLALPKTVPSFLPPQRQWIMENAACDYVFLMDDDLTFDYRYEGLCLKRSDDVAMGKMIKDVLELMETYSLVGISCRSVNTLEHGSVKKNKGNMNRCYCVNRSHFLSEKCTFAPFDSFLIEDLYVTLTMMKAGHPTCILYTYAQEHKVSNDKGGCSLYRTLELEEKSAKYIVKAFPDITRLRVKKNKAGNFGKPILNGMVMKVSVTVDWKSFWNLQEKVGGFHY